MMLTKKQALDEAKRQKQALAALGKWRRNLFVLTACILTLAVFGLRSSGWVFALGVAAAVLAGICFLLTLVVNLSIQNGRHNVEAILSTLQ